MRKYCFSAFLLLLFGALLLWKDEVISGAAEGLLLWYRFVLPSLLPFMILVDIMISTDTIKLLAKFTGPLMKWFPGVSKSGSFAVAAGFLCGYPMGAKVSSRLVEKGGISFSEGAYLLSFCNNASPMFITGILFARFIPESRLHIPFFAILILSPLLCSRLFRIYYTRFRKETFPGTKSSSENIFSGKNTSLLQMVDHSLTDSFEGIVKVGLYMMVFSIFVRLLNVLIPGTDLCKMLLLSSMEITTGLSILAKLAIPPACKYVLLMTFTSFGGLCAVFQTASMIQKSRLPVGPYIIEKLITALATSFLTYLYLLVGQI